MKLVALCGLHGAGKDTVADALPARKLAFADVLYREVSAAFDFMASDLKCRETKEVALRSLRLTRCSNDGFLEFNCSEEWEAPRSPRQILQWWGDYRRAQDPDYFVNAVKERLSKKLIPGIYGQVITDCRFPDEAAMVRQLGGQIWQVVRPGHNPPCNGHASENDGSEFKPDVIFLNNGTVAELQESALEEWNK